MPKLEYTVEAVYAQGDVGGDVEELRSTLSSLAEEGWEPIGFVPPNRSNANKGVATFVVLRRNAPRTTNRMTAV